MPDKQQIQQLLIDKIFLLEAKVADFRQANPHLAGLEDKHILKYGPKLVKLNDIPKNIKQISKTLNDFDRHQNKLKQKDFHQYGSWNNVEETLKPHIIKTNIKKTLENRAKDGSKIIYQDPELTVRHIKNKEAAIKYGKGTRWCISSKDEEENAWNQYTKNNKKCFFIDTPKQKYAYHEGDDSRTDHYNKIIKQNFVKDEKDQDVSITHLINKHPQLRKIKELVNSKKGIYFADSRKINKINLKNKINAALYPEHAGKLVKDENEAIRTIIAQHPQHAEKLVNDPEWSIRKEVAKHREHAGKLVKDRDSDVRIEVAKHPEHAGKLVNDPHPYVRQEVAKHPEHAKKLINNPDPDVRREVAQHQEHAGKLVNDPHRYVRMEVAKHVEHAGKLVNDLDPIVRHEVAQHPEHAGKLVNDPYWGVRKEVAKHQEHAGKLVNDPNEYIRKKAKETLKMFRKNNLKESISMMIEEKNKEDRNKKNKDVELREKSYIRLGNSLNLRNKKRFYYHPETKRVVKTKNIIELKEEEKISPEEYEEYLKGHDWHYMMADSRAVYEKGKRNETNLRLLSDISPKHKELWNKYSKEINENKKLSVKTKISKDFNPLGKIKKRHKISKFLLNRGGIVTRLGTKIVLAAKRNGLLKKGVVISEVSKELKKRYIEKAFKDMEIRQQIDNINSRDPHDYLSPQGKRNRKKFENRYNTVYGKLKDITEEELNEARFKIIKARIRGGKVQRRKKVSNVPGFTFRGGRLVRMSMMERRRRRLGQKRAKIKKRSKLNRALRKRRLSLLKRKRLGIG